MNSDQDIIERILRGDRDSFRLLVKRYENRVFCFVRNLLRDAHATEDIAQETFLSAYENLRSYDSGQALFSTWLLTIARNKCLNAIKKHRPIPVKQLPEPQDSRSPDSRLEQTEFYARFDEALDTLPFPQRTAFVLAEIQGLSYEEIGRIEQVKIGTVKSRIARAKEKLRELLQTLLSYVTKS